MAKNHSTPHISPGATIGIIGGGQLGRMSALAAAYLGYRTHIFCNQEEAPSSFVSDQTTVADYHNEDALQHFAASVDVITFEFENIPTQTIALLEQIKPVHPNKEALHIIQHRIREKDFITKCGIATTAYQHITSLESLTSACASYNNQAIIKTTELGYDGKGQYIISNTSNLATLWQEMNCQEAICEQKINLKQEISVITARSINGELCCFPIAENLHKEGILYSSTVPAKISSSLTEQAQHIAKTLAEALNIYGLLTVEFFIDQEDKLYVNELAPRPHNSGHYTMDACITSQFEQLIRAICGLPLGSTELHSHAVMYNLIGHEVEHWQKHIRDPKTKIHLYGKSKVKAGRKMGHVTTIMPNAKR